MPTRVAICPCCNRPLPPEVQLGGRLRQLIYDLVVRRGVVTSQELFDHLYGDDPNGGPLCGRVALRANIWHINQALKAHGVAIRGRRGRGSDGYELVAL